MIWEHWWLCVIEVICWIWWLTFHCGSQWALGRVQTLIFVYVLDFINFTVHKRWEECFWHPWWQLPNFFAGYRWWCIVSFKKFKLLSRLDWVYLNRITYCITSSSLFDIAVVVSTCFGACWFRWYFLERIFFEFDGFDILRSLWTIFELTEVII